MFEGGSEIARSSIVVNLVPAPTAIALLGMGGMVATRRHREVPFVIEQGPQRERAPRCGGALFQFRVVAATQSSGSKRLVPHALG